MPVDLLLDAFLKKGSEMSGDTRTKLVRLHSGKSCDNTHNQCLNRDLSGQISRITEFEDSETQNVRFK